MAGLVMPELGITWQNNMLSGLSMVTQTNSSLNLIAGTRRGYEPSPDILPGEIWIKDYTGMSDLDDGIPENRRDVMIHMQSIIVDSVMYPESDFRLFTYYEGTGKNDLVREEQKGDINGVCPLGPDRLIPIKHIPKDLDAYVVAQPGKTPIFGDANGRIPKTTISETVLDTTQANKAGGYASIENTGKISASVLPEGPYVLSTSKGANNGVCPLNAAGKLPNSVFDVAALKKLLGI